MSEDPLEGPSCAVVVDLIVRKLGELIEDHVVRVARQLRAPIVDFLDVALGARRATDVCGITDPVAKPVKSRAAHAGGQDGYATASEDPGNRNAAATIVPGRWPDRAVPAGIELPGDDPRHEARVCREDL